MPPELNRTERSAKRPDRGLVASGPDAGGRGWILLPRVGPGVSKSMGPEPGTLPTRPPSCQEQAGESSAVRGSEGSAGLLLVGADGREGWARCWEPGWEKTRCTVWWPARPRPARAAGSLTACQDATCHRLLSQLRMRQPELLGSRHRTSPRAGWPSRPAGFSHPRSAFGSDGPFAGSDPGGQLSAAMAREVCVGQRRMALRGAERCVRTAFNSDGSSRRRVCDSELQPKVPRLRSCGLARGHAVPGEAVVSCAFRCPPPSLSPAPPLLCTQSTAEVPSLLCGMGTRGTEARAEE